MVIESPDMQRAIYRGQKLFPEIIYDITLMEGNPYTVPEIQTVLEGITVEGRKVSDTLQVLNLKRSLELMFALAREGTFHLNKSTLCRFHDAVAKEETLKWGVFRDGPVSIAGANPYIPPSATKLDALWTKGEEAVPEIENPVERAIAVFLFISRTQFFYDANKRTARSMMNSILLTHGQDIISIPAKLQREFNSKMIAFYLNGEATEMMIFMSGLQLGKTRFINPVEEESQERKSEGQKI
jgi:Fic family protein